MEHLQGDAGPSNEPLGHKVAPKVKAASMAGAISVLIIWAATYAGVTIPPEVASAFSTLLAFAAGYLKAGR